jgi:hypothetical protein
MWKYERYYFIEERIFDIEVNWYTLIICERQKRFFRSNVWRYDTLYTERHTEFSEDLRVDNIDEEGSMVFFLSFGLLLPDYTASHSRRT